jgi:hypothetical protein
MRSATSVVLISVTVVWVQAGFGAAWDREPTCKQKQPIRCVGLSGLRSFGCPESEPSQPGQRLSRPSGLEEQTNPEIVPGNPATTAFR